MSDTYYNNDDIMQNIDKVADDVTAIKDIIINSIEFMNALRN